MSTGIARAKNSPRLVYQKLFSVFSLFFAKIVGRIRCKNLPNLLLPSSCSIVLREKIKNAGDHRRSDRGNAFTGIGRQRDRKATERIPFAAGLRCFNV